MNVQLIKGKDPMVLPATHIFIISQQKPLEDVINELKYNTDLLNAYPVIIINDLEPKEDSVYSSQKVTDEINALRDEIFNYIPKAIVVTPISAINVASTSNPTNFDGDVEITMSYNIFEDPSALNPGNGEFKLQGNKDSDESLVQYTPTYLNIVDGNKLKLHFNNTFNSLLECHNIKIIYTNTRNDILDIYNNPINSFEISFSPIYLWLGRYSVAVNPNYDSIEVDVPNNRFIIHLLDDIRNTSEDFYYVSYADENNRWRMKYNFAINIDGVSYPVKWVKSDGVTIDYATQAQTMENMQIVYYNDLIQSIKMGVSYE